jgi:prophage regulatory protein
MATILRLPSVKARTGLSRSSIYAFVSRGDFPRPILLGARAVGWNSEAVDAWIASRVEQSQANKIASPVVRGSANTSAEIPAEPYHTGRFGRTSLHMRLGSKAGRAQF